jgi:hypothetical protein
MTQNTYQNREEFMTSFLNNPRGKMKYNRARMFTRQAPNGEGYQIVAYGHEVLVEVTGNSVDFYTAHHEKVSPTVTEWVSLFGSVLAGTEGFDVTIHSENAPNTGIGNRLSESAKYITDYIGEGTSGWGDFSAVEQNAVKEVETACMKAFRTLTA